MSYKLISEVKEILKSVEDLFVFTDWNTSSEILGYPACVADVILKEYQKQVHYGQFYDANLRLGIYILADYDMADSDFEKLVDNSLERFFGIKTYNDISLQNTSAGHFEISGRKVKAFFIEIQFNKKEYK